MARRAPPGPDDDPAAMLQNRSMPASTLGYSRARLPRASPRPRPGPAAAFGFTLRLGIGYDRAQLTVGDGAVVVTGGDAPRPTIRAASADDPRRGCRRASRPRPGPRRAHRPSAQRPSLRRTSGPAGPITPVMRGRFRNRLPMSIPPCGAGAFVRRCRRRCRTPQCVKRDGLEADATLVPQTSAPQWPRPCWPRGGWSRD